MFDSVKVGKAAKRDVVPSVLRGMAVSRFRISVKFWHVISSSQTTTIRTPPQDIVVQEIRKSRMRS